MYNVICILTKTKNYSSEIHITLHSPSMQRITDELTIFILLSPDRPPDINHAWLTQTLKWDHWGHRGTVVHSPDVELVLEGKVHRTDGRVCDENFFSQVDE